MKESTQVIICICGHCKTEKTVSLVNAPITSFFCDNCKQEITNFNTKPMMIPAYTREYNSFNDGAENW